MCNAHHPRHYAITILAQLLRPDGSARPDSGERVDPPIKAAALASHELGVPQRVGEQ